MSSSKHPPSESVGDVVAAALRGEVRRRDFLRRVVLAGLTSSAAYQLLDETNATAQQPGGNRFTTMALGEEGNPPKRPDINPGRPLPQQPSPNPPGQPGQPGQPKLTTYAVGEESSQPPQPGRPHRSKPTTLAVGEEQRGIPTTGAVGEEQPRSGRPPATTHKVGEESKSVPPTATTLRVGEESPPRTSPSMPSPFPNYTTRAVGEEGNVPNPSRPRGPQLLERLRTPWQGFRRW